MKKLIYLFITTVMFVFMSCGGGETSTQETSIEVVECTDDCQKSCCLGCKATEDHATCLADHSCCAAHEDEATEGDEATEEADAHEGHDHESHEGHDHE